MNKLFKVNCTFEFVAFCSDQEDAKSCANLAFNEEHPKYRKFTVEEINSKQMPMDWTENCCPYRIPDDAKTIKELIDEGEIT